MRTLIRFFGLQRSGNHATIDWLLAQYKDAGYDTAFDNNRDYNYFGNIKHLLPKKQIPDYISEKVCYIISFENKDIRTFPKIEQEAELGFGKVYNVILVRDPFNLQASRLKHIAVRNSLKTNFIDFWFLYINEYLGKTNCLDHKITVNYNHWVESVDYRRELTEKFSIPFTDKDFNTMSYRGGSSFDKTTTGDELHKKVLTRWKEMLEVPEFRKVFIGRDDVFSLSKEVFGEIPGVKILLKEAFFH